MTKIEFGKKLNLVRKERDVTSEHLAEMCNMTPVFVRQIECGIRLPSLANLVEICNALQVSPAVLLGADLVFDEMEPVDKLIEQIRVMSPKQVELVYSTVQAMIGHM